MNIRIGNGYDIHRLVAGRPLLLGGVEEQVHQLVRSQGWQIGNIDSVIVAERPKLKPHLKTMRDRLAQILALNPNQISIKANTNEKLGPVGREEGIAAYTVVLLVEVGYR